jgi:hypothetical protein
MQTMDKDPDWDHKLTLSVTPTGLIQALFQTASDVHTGWTSCVESNLSLSDLMAVDEHSGNFARLVEQEFSEDEDPDVLWHDWTVEIRIGEVFVTGHWQVQTSAPPIDWEFCAREAENAFEKAAVLMGRRVRRVTAVEEHPEPPPPKSQHH